MVRAYHFVGNTLRDGSPIPSDGEWLVYNGPLEMCQSGLHASLEPFDALRYAPGHTLCLVDCEGIEKQDHDKFVCRRRRIVQRGDASVMLNYFARMQALSVVHLWDVPDVVLEYLMSGDSRAAAQDAAWAATRAATCAAAQDAARAAAQDAAQDAAWAAAQDAARAAAWAAAWDAAWAATRADFKALVAEFFHSAG